MRLSLADEFAAIHVYNLRGNQRTAGEQSRKEGGKVFNAGSRATVAITLLIKDPTHTGPATIHYTDIGDYLTREQKLEKIDNAASITALDASTITPNQAGDWLNQRSDDFDTFSDLASLFRSYGRGAETARDAWVYGFSLARVENDVTRHINAYEIERQRIAQGLEPASDPTRLSWSRSLRNSAARGRRIKFNNQQIQMATYRPFTKQHLYFDSDMNNVVAAMLRHFPTSKHENYGFVLTGPASHFEFCILATGALPDLHLLDTGQFFARWRFEQIVTSDGMLFTESGAEGGIVDGYRRVDNITDEALARFRAAYGETFTKGDVFIYVYGLLHSSDYRERYTADLKKMLPRIPLVEDAAPFVHAGRRLAELHMGYESVAPYPLDGLNVDIPEGIDPYGFFAVTKMAFAKVRDPQTRRSVPDRSTIVYNDRITLSGIPDEAYRYMLGSRSAIEWIIDRYRVKTDKPSGIVNDPNDWSREVGDPRYIIDLLARVVTVSLETMQIIDALPGLEIRENQHRVMG